MSTAKSSSHLIRWPDRGLACRQDRPRHWLWFRCGHLHRHHWRLDRQLAVSAAGASSRRGHHRRHHLGDDRGDLLDRFSACSTAVVAGSAPRSAHDCSHCSKRRFSRALSVRPPAIIDDVGELLVVRMGGHQPREPLGSIARYAFGFFDRVIKRPAENGLDIPARPTKSSTFIPPLGLGQPAGTIQPSAWPA